MKFKKRKIKINNIEEAIMRLLRTDSFYAYVVASVARRAVSKEICKTMAVVCNPKTRLGVELIYNPEFIEGIDDLEFFRFVVEHEMCHLALRHIQRYWDNDKLFTDKNFDPRDKHNTFNIGADMAINSVITDHYHRRVNDEVVSNYIHPSKANLPNRLSMEEYIIELNKKRKQSKNKNGEDDKDSKGGSGDSGNKGLGDMVGDHLWGYKVVRSKDGKDTLVPVDSKDLKESKSSQDINLGDFMRECINKYKKSRGELPGNLKQLLSEFIEVRNNISWRNILRSRLKTGALSRRQRTIFRANRRLHGFPGVSKFPGHVRENTYKIAMCLDVSGSVTDNDVMAAFSVLKDLKEYMSGVSIWFLQADTRVVSSVEMEHLEDFNFNIHGRGGTDFIEPLRYIEENISPDIILYFTDGLGPCPEEPPKAEIIWFITPDGQHPCDYSENPKKYGEEVRLDYDC